jgi:hypothetical protein
VGRRFLRAVAPAAGAAALLAASAPAFAQGCANCRQALEQNGEAGVVRGIFWSIVLLVTLPVLLAGSFLLLLRRAERSRREGGGGA